MRYSDQKDAYMLKSALPKTPLDRNGVFSSVSLRQSPEPYPLHPIVTPARI